MRLFNLKRNRFSTINCGNKRPQYWALKTKTVVDSTVLVQHLDKISCQFNLDEKLRICFFIIKDALMLTQLEQTYV